jgi:hypothetical protein
MPPTNDTPHRHAKKASPGRRKAKPKFEIPTETTAPDTVTGWVYRADEIPESAVAPREQPPAPAEQGIAHPFLVAGMGLIFFSVGTVGLMSVAAVSMMTVPMRFARKLWAD